MEPKIKFPVEKASELAIFGAFMQTFAQSSLFTVAFTDVQALLRYAPFRVRSQGSTAVLHYSTPQGVWQGAPVLYNMVQGLHVLRWQGLVLNPSGRGFFVRVPGSPLGNFTATHLFEETENGTVIRDELSCDHPAYAPLLTSLQVVYSFAQRREMAQMQAQAPTRELPQLDSGFAVG